MVFLVRKMRAEAQLRRFKVIVVTDRKDLQGQLSGTATMTGEVVDVAESAAGVKALARRKGPALIFATIQKYRDADTQGDAPLTASDLPGGSPKMPEPSATYQADEKFEVLNEDDEHPRAGGRSPSHPGRRPARQPAGGAARTVRASASPARRSSWARKSARMRSSASSSTATRSRKPRPTARPCRCSTRAAPPPGAIKDGASLDELFEDLFRQHTPEELEAIKQKYATRGHIFDAPALIADKARDMLRHYVTHILPNGYKAQIVAYSRLAAIRYFDALKRMRGTSLLARGRPH